MIVYWEYAFAENALLDGLLLYLAEKCACMKVRVLKLLLSACLGGCICGTLSAFFFAFMGGLYGKISFRSGDGACCRGRKTDKTISCHDVCIFCIDVCVWRDSDGCLFFLRNRNHRWDRVLSGTCACCPCSKRSWNFCGFGPCGVARVSSLPPCSKKSVPM